MVIFHGHIIYVHSYKTSVFSSNHSFYLIWIYVGTSKENLGSGNGMKMKSRPVKKQQVEQGTKCVHMCFSTETFSDN